MIFYRAMRRQAIQLEGERSSTLDMAHGRLAILGGFYALCFMLLAALAFDLTVIQTAGGSDLRRVMNSADAGPSGATIRRGNIYDRSGVLLATSLQTASLYADTRLISDIQKTAKALTGIFPDLAYGDVLQTLQSGRRFVWLRRNILPSEQKAVLMLGEPGLAFKTEDRRIYPQGALAAHLVGYTNVDSQGLSGIERNFETWLSQGQDLNLTLDIRLQHALKREMQTAMDEFSAIGGVGIVMDATSGDVLAGVSLPDFTPALAGTADKNAMFNRLTLGLYEMGSVFKIFSTAAFLEAYDVPMSTTFDASEPIRAGRFKINDFHAEDRILTIPEVFMYSSNIGSAMMGQAVGGDRLKDFYKDIGVLTPLSFEIREMAKPSIPDPWREVTTLTASYGHGVTTTPLQMASAVSSVINGGVLVRPRLVMPAESKNEKKSTINVRVVSEETSEKMRKLLRLVVTDGTGSKAEVPGYSVGGKTGTAEKITNGRYQKNKLFSSFVAAFPMDHPRYVVFIAIDEPKGTKQSFGYATGGWVAAPAAARVISALAAIQNIPPKPVAPAQEYSESLKQFVSVKAHE
jgi:cell division protein FtsI (penicillin-binding protein 3)